jgi:chloramphenicol 3-O phosphotransferase
MSQIILLNGSSSSGKTSICKAFQHLINKPFLTLGVDTFISMIPQKYLSYGEKSQEGCYFLKSQNSYGAAVSCNSGPFGDLVFKTAIDVVKTMADNGLNIIIDEVIWSDERMCEYKKILIKHNVLFIKVFCERNSAQERELLRGDREIGLANDQIDKINLMKFQYDLEINTDILSPFESAKKIIAKVS